MLFPALTPFTLLDYPGHVACVVYLPGCNFRCGYCHNPQFVLPSQLRGTLEGAIDEEQLFSFLEKRRGLLDGVVLCGGEPTMHHSLPAFASRLQSMGFLVKLDTNGSNPDMLASLLEHRLVDYVAMDFKVPLEQYHRVDQRRGTQLAVARSIRLLVESDLPSTFRTTVLREWHRATDLLCMARQLHGAARWSLQEFRPSRTLDPSYASYSPWTREEIQSLSGDLATHVGELTMW